MFLCIGYLRVALVTLKRPAVVAAIGNRGSRSPCPATVSGILLA
jgi:hypothetical protein